MQAGDNHLPSLLSLFRVNLLVPSASSPFCPPEFLRFSFGLGNVLGVCHLDGILLHWHLLCLLSISSEVWCWFQDIVMLSISNSSLAEGGLVLYVGGKGWFARVSM